MKCRSLAECIGTVGGLGHYTPMPGTLGSAVACIVGLAIPQQAFKWAILIVVAVGIWASGKYAKETGKHDPGEVVIDEVAGTWIAMYGHSSSCAILALFLFRVFDILKPFPVCTAEKLPGGTGIVADDLVGGILANLLLWGLKWLYLGGGFAALLG